MTEDSTKRKPGRRANGQYEKDFSGNRRGRPRKSRRIPHPDQTRDMVYELGMFKVPVTINGASYDVPLVIANLLTLASKGARGDAAAARSFLNTWWVTVGQELEHMARVERRFEHAEPAYLRERDPVEREKLKRAWEDVGKQITGMRDLESEPFPPRKRRRR